MEETLASLARSLGWSYAALWSKPLGNRSTYGELVFACGSFINYPGKQYDDTQWFYLQSLFRASYQSCYFAGSSAYACEVLKDRKLLWLSGPDQIQLRGCANQSYFFAVAGISTMLCVPWSDSVLELGSTSLEALDPTLLDKVHSFLSSRAFAEQMLSPIGSILLSDGLSPGSNDKSSDGAARGQDEEYPVARSSSFSLAPADVSRLGCAQTAVVAYDLNQGAPDSNERLGKRLEMAHDQTMASSLSTEDSSCEDMIGLCRQNSTMSNTSSSGTAGNGFVRWMPPAAVGWNSPGAGFATNQAMLKRSIELMSQMATASVDEGELREESTVTSRNSQRASQEQQQQQQITIDYSQAAVAKTAILAGHDEAALHHMMAERRRRQKQKENFAVLRSLIPSPTRMDRASILGDTIRYVKELKLRVQQLEYEKHQLEAEVPQYPRKRHCSNSSITSCKSSHALAAATQPQRGACT